MKCIAGRFESYRGSYFLSLADTPTCVTSRRSAVRHFPTITKPYISFVGSQHMPRLVNSFPSYCKHRASGQAVVTLCGQDFYLGPHGTKASKLEYDRLIAEWLARGRRPL